jgi:sugar phosphate isomerase/epimerase
MQGFAKLPVARIAHVHAKDCTVRDHKATWLELGTGAIPWSQQIDGLERGGYNGWISLETHWPGPNGDKQAGSVICGQNLKRMVS